MEYLDFELPIKELEDQLDKCQVIGQESDVDVSTTCKQIEKQFNRMKCAYLSPSQRHGRKALSLNPNMG